MKHVILLFASLLMLSSCGTIGSGLGKATRVIASPVRTVLNMDEQNITTNHNVPPQEYIK